ncbi:cell envelope biogenesis protein OmpA [Sandarakinorhabdus cyanobacteriorum]|uniref:Cell envelope biogenesis protein OmpA n=1 Tax=Sandarakinorhabdus cyanobacteriorum TaxID=1981098 RepID=A0A255Y6E4_9SPHN|nr:OmpA family protein [Sandarakinorhabdus cyanobacteriorum]OYQ24731.1 cell envelope biogenesis protein OmpA [Sandarakinorhabdus cyanobacteriorum]
MRIMTQEPAVVLLLAAAVLAAAPLAAQPAETTVTAPHYQKGPEIRGIISARSGDRIQVTADDGSKILVEIDDATRISASGGFLGLGRSGQPATALMNGLPITVATEQSGAMLRASQIKFRNTDLKLANMIHSGTAQGFAEQAAATQALKGRFADIDQYDIKRTANIYFDTGKWALSEQAKAELCATTKLAEGMKNALLLVVGYTDDSGPEEYNQQLSEKRASRVVGFVQQACGWKPYRMLTPTGMAEADPAAPNDTPEGKAQNRRVAVNVLVSKAADAL